MEISGKTAIVTGAASGIGLGIATALAEAGANVVMADIEKDAVEQAAHLLSGTNKQVLPVRIDVTREQSVIDALAEAERRFGKLHIACNNAGVPMHGARLVDVPVADWAFVIGVNVWGVIHGIRHFVPAILKHGEAGHVVNTASVAATQNRRGTNQGPYSMSKYAVLSLSEALEHELEGTNVGVTALCPGPIATNLAQGARHRPDHLGGPRAASDRGGGHGGASGADRHRPQAGRRAGDRCDPQQDLLRLRQRRAGRRDQGAAPPHRGGARDPLGDAVLGREPIDLLGGRASLSLSCQPSWVAESTGWHTLVVDLDLEDFGQACPSRRR